jgi:hypothetical protein
MSEPNRLTGPSGPGDQPTMELRMPSGAHGLRRADEPTRAVPVLRIERATKTYPGGVTALDDVW